MIENQSYITKEWLKQCCGTTCKCGDEFTCFLYNEGNININLTVDMLTDLELND